MHLQPLSRSSKNEPAARRCRVAGHRPLAGDRIPSSSTRQLDDAMIDDGIQEDSNRFAALPPGESLVRPLSRPAAGRRRVHDLHRELRLQRPARRQVPPACDGLRAVRRHRDHAGRSQRAVGPARRLATRRHHRRHQARKLSAGRARMRERHIALIRAGIGLGCLAAVLTALRAVPHTRTPSAPSAGPDGTSRDTARPGR